MLPVRWPGLLLLVVAETAEYVVGRLLLETAQQYRRRREQGRVEEWLQQRQFGPLTGVPEADGRLTSGQKCHPDLKH
jgi:hypothetical protein